ncbi:MAG: hypothetical protein ACLPND_02240 [Candidatus Korobacteraceae bacterium]|jgi:hypothetical protein
MSEIQYVTNNNGRKRVLQIDPRKHRALWEDFIDGLVSESRRNEKAVPFEKVKAARLKR